MLVGPETFDQLKDVDPWSCYLCLPSQRYGLLKRRPDWSMRVQEFFANESAMEFVRDPNMSTHTPACAHSCAPACLFICLLALKHSHALTCLPAHTYAEAQIEQLHLQLHALKCLFIPIYTSSFAWLYHPGYAI